MPLIDTAFEAHVPPEQPMQCTACDWFGPFGEAAEKGNFSITQAADSASIVYHTTCPLCAHSLTVSRS